MPEQPASFRAILDPYTSAVTSGRRSIFSCGKASTGQPIAQFRMSRHISELTTRQLGWSLRRRPRVSRAFQRPFARSSETAAPWPIFSAHAFGVAQDSASASTGSAPRCKSSSTSSIRPQRQAQPSGVLLSRPSRRSVRAPASSRAVAEVLGGNRSGLPCAPGRSQLDRSERWRSVFHKLGATPGTAHVFRPRWLPWNSKISPMEQELGVLGGYRLCPRNLWRNPHLAWHEIREPWLVRYIHRWIAPGRRELDERNGASVPLYEVLRHLTMCLPCLTT